MTKQTWIVVVAVLMILAAVGGYMVRGLLAVKFETLPNLPETSLPTRPEPDLAGPPSLSIVPPKIIYTNEEANVAWQTPVKIADLKLTDTTHPDFITGATYYQVGTVASGNYNGGQVILATVGTADIGGDYTFRFIKQGNAVVLLKRHSDPDNWDSDYRVLDSAKYAIDTGLTLSDLAYVPHFTDNGQTFKFAESRATFFDPTYLKQVFVDPKVGPVYLDATSSDQHYAFNGFYIKVPDGTLRTYSLDINFYDADHHIPKVIWSDGITNQVEYAPTDIGGCGSRNLAAVETSLKPTDLKITGKISNGESVYETIGVDSKLQNLYQFGMEHYQDPQLTFAQFAAKYPHPIFYWYDAFGRLIKFQRMDFQPAAECGKPVIYLYPSTTTKVSVKLEPKGGFTKSEPAYGNGWNVIATPQSQLTDLATGQTYPYLFWEGRGGLYETPKKGFVVAASEVHNFLLEKLTQLGLNQQERADFLAFWEPRMTGAPYFFVTFLGNQAMDQLAPLTISPKPDTVIRILMDFTPLAAPIPVETYTIRTPVRQGFTVVEWGGVIR